MENCPLPCSLYNCKRTYTNPEALQSHLRDHHSNPAQSLPGKSFLCSTIGCDGSFTSMQELMDHMRHHHKPNNFFLCESCRAKLRSYRTLLKHLQTCAKVARGNPPRPDPATLPDSAPPDPDSSPPECPTPPRDPPDSAHAHATAFPLAPSPPSRSPGTGPPASPPHTPPGSVAVWRKNQDPPAPVFVQMEFSSDFKEREHPGQSFGGRILWEHTRGRYSCLQCGHCTPDRQEMSAHIEGQHRGPRTSHGTDAGVALPSSLITAATENPNYLEL